MKIEDVLGLVRRNVLSLDPYSTARDECGAWKPSVFLDANESPYENGVNRYPDPRQKALKMRIASLKGLPPEKLFLGNGSDEAIDLAYRIFCVPGVDNVLSIAPSYGMYEVAAMANDVDFRTVALGEDFSLDTEALLAAADERTKLLFLCSPNNPSGNIFPRGQIEMILRGFRGILVLDEAYIDFSTQESLASMTDEYPNLLILQTLSKAWGMAGLRIGLTIAAPAVVALMSKVKYPYNISLPAQQSALLKLDREEEKNARVREIVGQRFFLSKELAKVPCVRKVFPSEANFLLVKVDDADGLYERLVSAGIIVRNRTRVAGCAGCLRITVGTPGENARLLHVLGVGVDVPCGTSHLGERHVRIVRKTGETEVRLELNLDGSGSGSICTGLPFFDHMLTQIPHHGGVELNVEASGDLQVDAHHTIEDVGIVLGEAIGTALGAKLGIGRYGFVLPMDDCDAAVLLDFGGRTDFRWKAAFRGERLGDVPTEMFSHFFHSVCTGARCNLHVEARGENDHHKAEAIFKAFARALRMAVARTPFPYEIPSSKGIL